MRRMTKAFRVLISALIVFLIQLPAPSQLAQADSQFFVHIPVIRSSCTSAIPFQESSDEQNEAEILRQINLQRAVNGNLPALTMNASLAQIARFHSIDMAKNNITTHDGSAGETAWTRYDWLCEDFAWKGEIIGWGFGGDVTRMIDWWMNSPGHHDIILSTRYTVAGVGYYRGGPWGHYWTVDFGSTAQTNAMAFDQTLPPTCTTETAISSAGGISVTYCQ